MNYRHDDSLIAVPDHVGVVGVFTGHMFLASSVVNYNNHYYSLSLTQFMLYITTMLHWKKIYHDGICKRLDITMCYIHGVNFFYHAFLMHKIYTLITVIVGIFVLIIYYTNEYIFYYQSRRDRPLMKSEIMQETENFVYFSLKYTLPNTCHRELAYYHTVVVHTFCLHIMFSLYSMSVITLNPMTTDKFICYTDCYT
tara:strand:+ start:372 stop:962 length:591 start_codon:yes stop_codon:yes gene_type:complete